MREKEHLDLTEEERRLLQALRDPVKGAQLRLRFEFTVGNERDHK